MKEQNLTVEYFEISGDRLDDVILMIEDKPITNAELRAAITNTVCHLQGFAEVERDDIVGVVLPNGLDFIKVLFAAAAMGLILVPVNPSLPTESRQKIFDDIGASFIIDAHVMNDWNECHTNHSSVAMLNPGQLNDIFLYLTTSGSTGKPKPIILTQRDKRLRASQEITVYGLTSEDTMIVSTPMYHSLGLRQVIVSILSLIPLVVMTRYSPELWIDAVQKHQVTFSMLTSNQIKGISNALIEDKDLRFLDIRCVVSSSSLLDHKSALDMATYITGDLYECYGTSEVAIATSSKWEDAPAGSVGKPIMGVNIMIADDGEILVKSMTEFSGYLNIHNIEGVFANIDGVDWFNTGDLGRVDENGYLMYLGRKKDIIITGGMNVYPLDVESVILELPEVLECVAFPINDDNLGEIVAVAVVCEDKYEHNKSVINRIKRLCGSKLADYQQPREIFLVNSLPKNDMGKIVRSKIFEALKI